jgi:hypothetical protein
MQIPKPKRWEILSWIPIAVGLYWLLARNDGHWLIWALLPGSVLLSTGVALLLMPGDPRITAYMALASVAGVGFALILFVIGNVGPALVCLIGSAGCFLVAGPTLPRRPHCRGAGSGRAVAGDVAGDGRQGRARRGPARLFRRRHPLAGG